jgi:RNA polymerase sigma-70 factor (ECF subfamily)
VSDPHSGHADPGGEGPGREGAATVGRVFRGEYRRLIASLVRRFGDIDLAEEAAGEALVATRH